MPQLRQYLPMAPQSRPTPQDRMWQGTSLVLPSLRFALQAQKQPKSTYSYSTSPIHWDFAMMSPSFP